MYSLRPLFLGLILLGAFPAHAEGPSDPIEVVGGHPVYGTRMPEGSSVPIAQALSDPGKYIGVEHKFSGRIAKVCQSKGCWMVLADGETHARVMFGHDDFFIPKDSTGNAVVYGSLEVKTLTEAVAKHMAQDAGQDPEKVTGETEEYSVTASSVMLLPAG